MATSATALLNKGASFDGIRDKVQAALDARAKAASPGIPTPYCWIRDIYAKRVVYSCNNGELYQCDYSIKKDVVTLGEPTRVEIAYKPLGESHRAMCAESIAFEEKAYDAKTGTLKITVIQPGFNKSKQRYYPASVLKRDHKIFENAKMFADHQTTKESTERPEGSVNNWVASIKKVWAESDGTVRAEAAVIDPPFKAKLEELDKQGLLHEMGTSIRAVGEASKAEVEGHQTLMVESLLHGRSVDFVTYAGAGGYVEAIESVANDENDIDLISEAQLRQRRPDLVALIESNKPTEETLKTLEQQLQEAQAKVEAEKARADAAEAKLTESERNQKKADAKTELTRLMTEAKLPAKAQERLSKQFAEAETTDKMKEAVAEEAAYIASFVTTPAAKPTAAKPTNLGEADQPQDTVHTAVKPEEMVESWKLLGMTQEQAEVAAGIKK